MKFLRKSLKVTALLTLLNPLHCWSSVVEWNAEEKDGTLFVTPSSDFNSSYSGFSSIYSGFTPKAPMIASYNPNDHTLIDPTALFCMHFPSSSSNKLPGDIQSLISSNSVSSSSLRIMAVAQSYPLSIEGYKYGFYPHFATDVSAPNKGDYRAWRDLKMSLHWSDTRTVEFFKIDRSGEGEDPKITNTTHETGGTIISSCASKQVILHPACSGDPKGPCVHGTCDVVLSPTPLGIKGLNPSFGQSFYSYITWHDSIAQRAVVTLHILLDNLQNRTLNTKLGELDEFFVPSTKNLIKVGTELKESPAFKGRGGSWIKFLSLIS